MDPLCQGRYGGRGIHVEGGCWVQLQLLHLSQCSWGVGDWLLVFVGCPPPNLYPRGEKHQCEVRDT